MHWFATVGLAFDLLGLLAFRASQTTVNPMKPQRTSALVTGGVFRLTRNPMYVGMSFQPEERVLSQLFGEPYAQYTTRVRRWL